MRFITRSAAILFAVAALALTACTPTPTPGGGTTTTLPGGATLVGQACAPGVGVTVVVDFTSFNNTVEVGCATGAQADGFSALSNAGFIQSDGGEPGVLCTIDGLPSDLAGGCFANGYWSYWRASAGGSWSFAATGASDGPWAIDSLEGWSWAPAPAYDAQEPRITPAGLGL